MLFQNARFQIRAKPVNTFLRKLYFTEYRNGLSHAGLQVGLGPSPIGTSETVGAIVGDGNGDALQRAQVFFHFLERSKNSLIDGEDFGELILGKPKTGVKWIPGKNELSVGDPFHL